MTARLSSPNSTRVDSGICWRASDAGMREIARHVDDLEAELDRADVVLPVDVPFDVVTMNSEVAVRDMDSNEEMTFAVVFPSDADVNRQRISILAPIGTAVLGSRVGDMIDWRAPGRTRRLKIERVLFQPEAAGQFDR